MQPLDGADGSKTFAPDLESPPDARSWRRRAILVPQPGLSDFRLLQRQAHFHCMRLLDSTTPDYSAAVLDTGTVAALSCFSLSASRKASSSACPAFKRGSHPVSYWRARSASEMLLEPPVHSVTFCPVISMCTPPG